MTKNEAKWDKLFDTPGTTLEEKLPQAEQEVSIPALIEPPVRILRATIPLHRAMTKSDFCSV